MKPKENKRRFVSTAPTGSHVSEQLRQQFIDAGLDPDVKYPGGKLRGFVPCDYSEADLTTKFREQNAKVSKDQLLQFYRKQFPGSIVEIISTVLENGTITFNISIGTPMIYFESFMDLDILSPNN